ncbi:MAG: DMT family transporter [Gammaproteobacteria bacterium]
MLRGVVLIALAAVSWGTTGSVTTVLVAGAGVDPWIIGAARMWVAAALLLVATRVVGAPLPLGRDRLGIVFALGACMAAFQATYFTAVTMTGIAITALVAICSAPVMIAALAVLVLGERVSTRVIVAITLGVVGTVLLIANPHAVAPAAPRLALGTLLALGAALSYAVYVIAAKRALVRTEPLPLAAVTFTVAAILSTFPVAWSDAPVAQLARGWPWLVYMGAVATAAAYALYTIGLRHVPAVVAGIVSLFEPLTATLLGVLLFGERLGATGVTGAVLLFAAVALALIEERQPTSGRA